MRYQEGVGGSSVELEKAAQKRGVSIGSLLEKGSVDIDKLTIDLLIRATRDNPALSAVEVCFVSSEEEPNTGGFFDRVRIDEKTFVPTLFIVKEGNGDDYMQRIMEVRKPSNERVANMLGISMKRLTPDFLKRFIILHELGHAEDYLRNYQENPNYQGSEASKEWGAHYDASLSSLPVSGMSPAELLEEVSRFKSFTDFLKEYPEIAEKIDKKGIKTLNDLLTAQELAYRASPYEAYADNFAINYLKD